MSKNQLPEFIRDMRGAGDPVHVSVGESQVFVTHIISGVVEVLQLEESDDSVSVTLTSWRGLTHV